MYQAGQKLWFVPRQRYAGEPREVMIKKVGRTWLTLDNGYRADIETLVVDGGGYSPPAVCYLSQLDYETEFKLNNAWSAFRSAVDKRRNVPPGVDPETIDRVRELLGLKD